MYTHEEMRILTHVTDADIAGWMHRGWWLKTRWTPGCYYSAEDVVAIGVFRYLLRRDKRSVPYFVDLSRKAGYWLSYPSTARYKDMPLAGIVNHLRGNMNTLDKQQMGRHQLKRLYERSQSRSNDVYEQSRYA